MRQHGQNLHGELEVRHMWLSKRIMQETPESDPAAVGTVSIGGLQTAVVTDGEKRSALVFAPGGYCWRPSAGENVLVMKGNELYIAGKLVQLANDLQSGEVRIFSEGASLVLKNDGRILMEGELYLNGRRVEPE